MRGRSVGEVCCVCVVVGMVVGGSRIRVAGCGFTAPAPTPTVQHVSIIV